MKINAIRNFAYINNFNNLSPAVKKAASPVINNRMSYFDIPFYGLNTEDKYEIPSQKEIDRAVLNSLRTKNAAMAFSQKAFSLCTQAQNTIDDTLDKFRRSESSGIDEYTNENGALIREVFYNDSAKPFMMEEYEGGKTVRVSEIFDDGSLKIDDKEKGAVIFADKNGSLKSVETFWGAKPREVLRMDDDRVKYVAFKLDLQARDSADVFEYYKNYDESRIAIKYFETVYGKNFTTPDRCFRMMLLANDDLEAKTPFSPLVYLENVATSPSKTSFSAQNGVFYTFDGVLNDSKGVAGRIVSEEPISYNKDIKAPVDERFPLSSQFESVCVMMNHNGEFLEMPV